MGYSRSRTITLLITLTTLTSNILSSLLFHHLPDDPYRLASTFGWYLHFANLLSITGFIGTIKNHALSIAIFSNYLLLDTLLFSIPRFLLLGLFYQLSTSFCTPTSTSYPLQLTSSSPSSSSIQTNNHNNHNAGLSMGDTRKGGLERWTGEGCLQVLYLAQLALGAGVLAATVLQVVGALWVRGYARGLWVRGWRREMDDGEEGLVGEESDDEGCEKL